MIIATIINVICEIIDDVIHAIALLVIISLWLITWPFAQLHHLLNKEASSHNVGAYHADSD